jgi:WXG100 family type VII secretion target
MASSFKVTTSVLTSQANELSSLNGRFKTAVEQLVSSEANLKTMWEGEANDAFHAAFTTDKGKMDEFYNLILQYVEKLNSIATRYSQTEQTNTQIASNRTY